RGPGAADALVLAPGVERLPRAATGRAVRALGRPGRPRAFRTTGCARDRRDARLSARVRHRGDDLRHPPPAAAGAPAGDTAMAAGDGAHRARMDPLRLLRLPETRGRPWRAGFVHRPVPWTQGVGGRDAPYVPRGADPGHGLLGPADGPGA